jgi:hypothetical protein
MEADNVMFALKILTRWMDGQKPLPEQNQAAPILYAGNGSRRP